MWRERLFPDWTFRLPSGEKRVLLTFDDGPHPDSTPLLLELLRSLQLRAVHFLNGNQCKAHPQLVREIKLAGHQLALHGMSHHSVLFARASYVRNSIEQNRSAIQAAGVEPLPFYRPPYGRFNFLTTSAVRKSQHQGMLWSAIGGDWKSIPAETIWQNLQPQLTDGAIILLHDSPAAINKHSLVLARLADYLHRHHLTTTLLPESLAAQNL